MHWRDIPFHPPTPTLRRFGFIAAVLLLTVGSWQLWHDRGLIGGVLVGLALPFAALAFARPVWLRPVYVGLMILTFPLNWIVSHVMLAVIFYCLFTPVALLFRLLGRDVLGRHAGAARDSYWTPKAQPEGVRSYFRQS
jgi:hypothetical protein